MTEEQLISYQLDRMNDRAELESRAEQYGLDFAQAEAIVRYGMCIGSHIECHGQMDRTMPYAKAQIDKTVASKGAYASGTTILASSLSSSKGRFKRSWHAPEGGLWGCLVHVGGLLDSSRSLLPLAMGVACCETMRDLGVVDATLRWVNDVLAGGRKIAGFLAETHIDPVYSEKHDILGFGINVQNSVFPAWLKDEATSLSRVVAEDVKPHSVCAMFLAKLRWNVGLLYFEEKSFLEDGCFHGVQGRHLLIDSWRKLSDTIGRRVVYGFDVIEAPQYEAQVMDIRNDGGLVMYFDDGSSHVEFSGEVRYLKG